MVAVTLLWMDTQAHFPGWAPSHTLLDGQSSPWIDAQSHLLGEHTATLPWMGTQAHSSGWARSHPPWMDAQLHLLDAHTVMPAGWANRHALLDGHPVTPSWIDSHIPLAGRTVTPLGWTHVHTRWMGTQLHPLDGHTVTLAAWSHNNTPQVDTQSHSHRLTHSHTLLNGLIATLSWMDTVTPPWMVTVTPPWMDTQAHPPR